jgi:hypothetical protein
MNTNAAALVIKHTPTPWVVSAPGIITAPKAMQDIGHVCYTGTDGGTDANAAFIVRACNSHDDLVMALAKLVAEPGDPDYRAQARAALAKAGAA